MPNTIKLASARERHVVAKTFVRLSQEMRASFNSDHRAWRGAGAGTLLMVAAGVVVGHAEGRPMTSSKIAAYVGLPRTTVLRKLEQLIGMNVVVRRGRNYCVSPERAEHIPREYVQRATRAIAEAAESLSRRATI